MGELRIVWYEVPVEPLQKSSVTWQRMWVSSKCIPKTQGQLLKTLCCCFFLYVISSIKEDKMKNQVKCPIKAREGRKKGEGKWTKEPGQQTETVEGMVDINPTVITTSITSSLKTNERHIH